MNWRTFTLSLMLTPLVVLTSSGSFAKEQNRPPREEERSVFIGEMKGEGKRFVQEIRGYFTKRQTQDTLNLKWLKRKAELDTEESVKVLLHGKQIYDFKTNRAQLIGICRSPSTELDHLIFHFWAGGVSDPGWIGFVHYDQKSKRFKSHGFQGNATPIYHYATCTKGRNIYGSGSGIPCHCTWEARPNNEARGKEIFALLRPSEKPTTVSAHETELIVNRVLPTKKFSRIEFDRIRHQITNLNDERFFIRDLEENNKWKIFAVYFEESWSSWGVMLAKNETKDRWIAFYNIPRGGSKAYLFMPKKISLGEGGVLKAKLCTHCKWWGVYEDFVINLNAMTVSSDTSSARRH